jgi:hypothetical protein
MCVWLLESFHPQIEVRFLHDYYLFQKNSGEKPAYTFVDGNEVDIFLMCYVDHVSQFKGGVICICYFSNPH